MNYEREERSPWGCILGGCLGAGVVLILLVVGGGFFAYRAVSTQIEKYTSTEPVELPKVVYSEEELQELKDRVKTVTSADASGDSTDPQTIELSEADINALLAQEEQFQGRVYVRIREGKLTAEVSMPIDELPGGKRYFNGAVTLSANAVDGKPVVKVVEARVNGEPVPPAALGPIQSVNLAEDVEITIENRKMELESIMIEDDRLIITPRILTASPTETGAGQQVDEESDTEADPAASENAEVSSSEEVEVP